MERWLRNQGKDEQANKVYLAMRSGRRRSVQMNPVTFAADWLFDLPVWLSMRCTILFGLFALSLLISTILFLDGSSTKPRGATPGYLADPSNPNSPDPRSSTPIITGMCTKPSAWPSRSIFPWLSFQFRENGRSPRIPSKSGGLPCDLFIMTIMPR